MEISRLQEIFTEKVLQQVRHSGVGEERKVLSARAPRRGKWGLSGGFCLGAHLCCPGAHADSLKLPHPDSKRVTAAAEPRVLCSAHYRVRGLEAASPSTAPSDRPNPRSGQSPPPSHFTRSHFTHTLYTHSCFIHALYTHTLYTHSHIHCTYAHTHIHTHTLPHPQRKAAPQPQAPAAPGCVVRGLLGQGLPRKPRPPFLKRPKCWGGVCRHPPSTEILSWGL